MTSALMCDGCGNLVTDRQPDGSLAPAERWWQLEQNPAIIGPGLASASYGILSASLDTFETDDEPLHAEVATIEVQPPLHFCTLDCLRCWPGLNP